MMEQPMRRRLFGAEELFAVVAYTLGYQPDDDLVVVLLTEQRRIRAVERYALHTPPETVLANLLAAVVVHDADEAIVVGYGPATAHAAVTAVIDLVEPALPVRTGLLVTGDTYTLLCGNPGCPGHLPCPFDIRSASLTTELTVRGVPLAPSKSSVRALLEPDLDIQARTVAAIAARRPPHRPPLASLGRALRRARTGDVLSDADAADLAVALLDSDVRHAAWLSTDGQRWQQQLWLGLARRVDHVHLTAPASLAAWCAWRRNESLLASMAAQRALQAAPHDRLANAISSLIDARVSPGDLLWPPNAFHRRH